MPIGSIHPDETRPNIDGLLTLSEARQGTRRAYVQVFRSGGVEAVACLSDATIELFSVGMQIVQHARIYALALAESGAEAPFVVTASILAVRGKMIGSMREMRGFQGQAADRDQLHLTDVVLEAVPDGDPSCGLAMRPILDQLANAAGHAESPSFDERGAFILR